MQLEPSLISSFTYKDKIIKIEWFDLLNKPVPNLPWQQVYVIGDLGGKVPIVHYTTGDMDNLPGGKTEPGESIEKTLRREIQEEINCEVLSWKPLGFQKLTEPDGKIIYQMRAFAKLKSLGEFVEDIGGSVVGYSLVDLDALNSRIQYGDVGDKMVELAKRVM